MGKKIYCFLGLPASGKGTQAEMFAQERGFTRVGIGDLVREEMKTNTGDDEIITTIRKLYSDGAPITDEIIFKLLEKKLNSVEGNVVFDNFPLGKGQCDFLLEYAKENNWDKPIIIYIKIDPEFAVKRISSRRICPKCNAIFIGGETCDKCGAELISRTDDNEVTVRKRIENYMPNIEEVINIYKENGKVIEIDGEPSIPEVKAQIDKIE